MQSRLPTLRGSEGHTPIGRFANASGITSCRGTISDFGFYDELADGKLGSQ